MGPGDVIDGRFEIVAHTADGGMGAVYQAADLKSGGRRVALKVLRAGADDPSVDRTNRATWSPHEARLMREAELLAQLRHPAIVQYVAHGVTESQRPYLAMEWVDGPSLADLLPKPGLTLAEVVRFGQRVAEGLARAHAIGVIHRDIKPSNLLLPDGDLTQVKIADFGLARPADPGRALTRAGSILGTPGYMAPEQTRAKRDLTTAIDVYSLGCVLFEMLVGQRPFFAEDAASEMARGLTESPPRCRDLLPSIPALLDDLIHQMMSPDPKKRLSDCAAVARALEAVARSGQAAPTITRADDGSVRQLDPPDELATITPSFSLPANTSLSTLSETERQLVSVISCHPAGADQADLTKLFARFGLEISELSEDRLLTNYRGGATLADQVSSAARCALSLARDTPDASPAIVTQRMIVRGKLPAEEVDESVERTRNLAEGARLPGIPIDMLTAKLLGARFRIETNYGGYSLVGAREGPGPERKVFGRVTPWVGRRREMRVLRSTFDECVEEEMSAAVILTAAAGMGKSRLAEEFVDQLYSESGSLRLTVWTARGDPVGSGAAWSLLSRLIRRAANIPPGSSEPDRRELLGKAVAERVPEGERSRVAAFLGELVGAPAPDEAHERLREARQDAMFMGDQIQEAWEEFVAGECDRNPVLIVLDDLHWGDLSSVQSFDSLLRRLDNGPLMIVALARTDVLTRFPALWGERRTTQLNMSGLGRKASVQLIERLLGRVPEPALVDELLGRAEGNPLYLEELVRAVADGGTSELPDSVLAMVQARLQGLDGSSRKMLRAATFFGRRFKAAGIAALLGRSNKVTQVDEWLSELVDREVLVRRGTVPADSGAPRSAEYSFRHALFRDAAKLMLTPEDDVLGHRLAAQWLESQGQTDAMVLAEHFRLGDMPERAAPWYAEAASKALGGNDLDVVLEAAQHGIDCDAWGELLGKLQALRCEAFMWRGENASAAAAAWLALGHLPTGGAAWYRAAGQAAISCARMGDTEGLMRVIAGLGSIDGSPDSAGIVALVRAAVPFIYSGDFEMADQVLEAVERAANSVTADGDATKAAQASVGAFRMLVAGDLAAHLELMEEAAARFESAGRRRHACEHLLGAGFACMEVGLYDRACEALQRAVDTAELLGLHHLAAAALHNLGLARARAGDPGAGRRAEEDALERFRRQGNRRSEGAALTYLAEIHSLSGDLDEAEACARRSIDAASEVPTTHARALATLVRILLLKGGDEAVSEAVDLAHLADDRADDAGHMHEGESLVRLALAEALDAAGHTEAAAEALETARERLEERASKFTVDDHRQSFLEGVPENQRTLALSEEWSGASTNT